MGKLFRLGVSLEASPLKKSNPFIATQRHTSRSEAICDLIRERLAAEEWKTGKTPAMGMLSLVHSHEVRELAKKPNDIQHHHRQPLGVTARNRGARSTIFFGDRGFVV